MKLGVSKLFVVLLSLVSIALYGASKDDVNWCDISKDWDAPSKSTLTFVDLFCGAGGLSKGLEMAGMRGICGLDYFEEAGRTYSRNFDFAYIVDHAKPNFSKPQRDDSGYLS